MKKVLAIVGPTAVGKTSLSIKLAKKYNGEIISGDSMQVYRHLDIGTAKITPEEMQGVKHYLINVRNVNERFSVADFKQEAEALINNISSRDKLPIIVGGTGFYLQALLNDLTLGGNDENHAELEKIRNKLNQQSDKELLNSLKAVDKNSFETIDHKNRRRIIRALEVYYLTGNKFSDQVQQSKRFNDYIIGLNTQRSLLYQRINQRVDIMIKQGLINEAEWLFKQKDVQQAQMGIGYREWPPYLANQADINQVIDEIKKDSRHYAKRQLTWFRNKMDVHWYDILQNEAEINQIENDINHWLGV